MGLIRSGAEAVRGTLADQWLEFFYCDSLDKEVLMAKGQKRVGSKSSNTKGNDNIITRIGLQRKVDHLIASDEKLSNYLNTIDEDIACILVDEAQFLTRDQVDELFMYAKLKNKPYQD